MILEMICEGITAAFVCWDRRLAKAGAFSCSAHIFNSELTSSSWDQHASVIRRCQGVVKFTSCDTQGNNISQFNGQDKSKRPVCVLTAKLAPQDVCCISVSYR